MTIRFFQFSLLAVFALAVAGCAPSSSAPADPDNSIRTKNLSEAQALIATADVYCADAKGCSPSIAMLVGTQEHAAFSCTAFLIGDDVIATNGHCVPDDLKTGDVSCDGRVSVLFPAIAGYARQQVDCAKILAATGEKEGSLKPDYAFLKLKTKVVRPRLSISRAGLQDEGSYTVMKIDPDHSQRRVVGNLRRGQCTVKFNTLQTSGWLTPLAPVMNFSGCQIVTGNSGSPMIDRDGRVGGIVFAKSDADKLEQVEAMSGLPIFEPPLLMGLGTNYACVDIPVGLAEPMAADCATVERSTSVISAAVKARMAIDIDAKVAAAKLDLDPSIDWVVSSGPSSKVDAAGILNYDAGSSIVMLVPNCLHDPAQFLSTEKKNWFSSFQTFSEREVPTRIWNMTIGYNRHLQLEYRVTPVDASVTRTARMRYNPNDLSKTGKTKINFGSVMSIVTLHPLYSGELSTCAK